jgi:acetyl esterase/lipase
MRSSAFTVLSAGAVVLLSAANNATGPVCAADGVDVIRDVTYVVRGEQKMLADVYLPRGEGPFPAVLMVHGGGWISGAKWHMARHAQVIAEHGYTVASIQYRLAPLDKFPAQIEDCKEAVRWMRRNAEKYKIDASRIAGYGYSAGGHLVCLLGVTDASAGLEGLAAEEKDAPSTRLQAVVAGGAPCNFEYIPANSNALAFFLGGSRRETPEAYRLASPTSFVSKDDPPVFFFHGADDQLVPRTSPEALKKQLHDLGVRTEMYIVPDKGHITAFLDNQTALEALKFLDDVLKNGAVKAQAE